MYVLFILTRIFESLRSIARENAPGKRGVPVGTVAQLKYWQWISVPLSAAELRDVKS